jgi:alginate O-acetyltransferase complex protein AlgI
MFVVLLGWVLFRCGTWEQSGEFFRALAFAPAQGGLAAIPWNALAPDVLLPLAVGLCFCVPVLPAARARCSQWGFLRPILAVGSAAAQMAVLALCLLSVGAGSHNPFIYFRF